MARIAPFTLGPSALLLAPMEGVTDFPMRKILTQYLPFTHCVAEFLRISQQIPPDYIFSRHLPEMGEAQCRTESGTPVIFQLLGGDPEKMAQAALVAVREGAKAIDINFGCPAPTVNRNDGGATLLQYPHRIYEIVKALRQTLPQQIPVSAKLRLGWDSMDQIHRNAEEAARGGADWITIHGRTKRQGYAPPAYWKPIGDVHHALGIPVIANGDIWTIDDFKRCQDETGCSHFMLGRGALATPQLVLEIAKELGLISSSDFSEPPASIYTLFGDFIECCLKFAPTSNYALTRLKQWAKQIYVRDRSFLFFEQIKTLQTLDQLRVILSESQPPLNPALCRPLAR